MSPRVHVLALGMCMLTMMLAGCFTPAPSQEVSWEEIEAKTVAAAAGSTAFAVESFTDQSALEEAVPAWERLDIDLTDATALRLTWGPLHGVGHEIRIHQVLDGEIHVTLVSPGAYCVGGDIWTKEVLWVRLDRPDMKEFDVRTTELTEPCAPRPDRMFHMLLVQGELAQTPPNEGSHLACGRPVSPLAGLDLATRRLYVHASHDFAWPESWLVVHDDVQLVDDASTCDLSWLSAHEGNHTWRLGSVELTFERGHDTPLINGLSAQNMTIPFDEELHGERFVGEIDVIYAGAWSVREIVVVPDEGLVAGDVRGFWRA